MTLYGLPIVAGRTVAYGADRPGAVARAVHPPRARRGRLGHAPRASSPTTARALEEVEALEDRARRRDILVDDEALFDFFDARIPADVVSGAHFDRWWRDERRRRPDLLTYTRELLVPGAADALDRRGAPGGLEARATSSLPLTYRFEPGRRATTA